MSGWMEMGRTGSADNKTDRRKGQVLKKKGKKD